MGVGTVKSGPSRTRTIADREQAIREALTSAQPNDVVVIAGKGSETVQVIADRERPFDDRETARQTLRDMGWTENKGSPANSEWLPSSRF